MNTMTKILFSLISIFTMLIQQSCRMGNNVEDYLHPEPPIINVYFVPLDGVSSRDIKKLSEDFTKHFADGQWEPYTVTSLSHNASPVSCLNDPKTRLRANSLLRWLFEAYKDSVLTNIDKVNIKDYEYYIIGVTDKDISTSIHGSDDYGILGLSYLGKGNTSVISTHRLSRKKDLWKLAVHEFCHGFYGCPHCENDDPHCIMADAKGGNPKFEIKDSLCLDCAARCVICD